jgi:transcriptional regulator with XRE-family HTH domain
VISVPPNRRDIIAQQPEEARVSHFGDLVKRLRKEKDLTLEDVAKKIGSHKGYVSGIENDKVNPPSVKIIRKFARLFGEDERAMVRLAWVDKAPALIKEDAELFLRWFATEGEPSRAGEAGAKSAG